MILAAPPAAGADWGAGFDPIDYYDTDKNSLGVTVDNTAGTVAFGVEAIWDLTLQASVGHVESNNGRETSLRLFNVTEASPIGTPFLIPIARNQPGSVFNITARLEVVTSAVGDAVRFEIGGGDTVTGIDWDSLSLDATLVAWQYNIPP